MTRHDVVRKPHRRVAVLADIHANASALDAVLSELERERPDAIVVAGDVVSGPQPVATLERLVALDGAHFVRGNADRAVVEAFDEGRRFDPDEQNPARMVAWDAQRITREQRDFLAGFADRVVLSVGGLGDVLFCHATPRSDEEIVTSATPEPVLRAALEDVGQRLIVCGHTHVQYERDVGSTKIVNAGSVGMPFERPPGAYWLMLGPTIELRRTDYDHERTAAAVRAGDYWNAASAADTIVSPPDGGDTEAMFERAAERLRSGSGATSRSD